MKNKLLLLLILLPTFAQAQDWSRPINIYPESPVYVERTPYSTGVTYYHYEQPKESEVYNSYMYPSKQERATGYVTPEVATRRWEAQQPKKVYDPYYGILNKQWNRK